MGVRQDYYGAFAEWLAQQGYRVATFDYRGMGESPPLAGTLRGFRADARADYQIQYTRGAATPLVFRVEASLARGRFDDPRLPYSVTLTVACVIR